jgi:hypothetical protein
VIAIKYVGANRDPHLIRSSGDASWLQTPVGAAGCAGSGPIGKTCADCLHADLSRLKLSDQGRAAPCLERARLANGKGAIQEVPLKMAACSLFSERPDKTTAFAFADERLAQQLTEKRAKIDTWRAAIDRTTREIRELELARHECKPEPIDAEWANAEPAAPHDTS